MDQGKLSGDAKRARQVKVDALCLAFITIASAIPYLGLLGFYSDDWSFLAGFHFDEAAGRLGLGSILDNPSFRPRPLQGLYLAGLYKLFGLHPLGHHIVNTAVLAAAMPLLYLLLARLRVGRSSAFAATLVLIVLPQLSTVRVWYSVFQIPLSMVFALGSLHLQLTYFRSGRVKWAVAALVAAILSIAAYEIFAPLLVAFAFGIAWLRGRDSAARPLRRWLPMLLMLAAVAAAIIGKSLLSERVRGPDAGMYLKGLIQLVRRGYDWRVDYGLNIFASAVVNFWHPFVGWGKAVASLVRGEIGPVVIGAAIAVAALSFWRLCIGGDDRPCGPRRMMWLGIAAFVLGHATFLLVPDIMFSPSGMANRALVAAAIGVALTLAALLALAARFVPARGRAFVLPSAIAAVAFVGVCRVGQVAGYWAAAPQLQARVLDAARHDLRQVPVGATVILDGVCPYQGPAIVFEAAPDVSGALRLALGKRVGGDVVSPRAALTPEGFQTSIYGEPARYPYGPTLYVYDPRRHVVVQLDDQVAAQSYFGDPRRAPLVCPRGYVGQGVMI